MNEKYNKLFALPENLYNSSAPIVISSGYLLKDNETEKIIAQIKFRSISSKTIIAIKLSILAYDAWGNKLDDIVEHQYLDLSLTRQTGEYGEKTCIALPDNARSFACECKSVIFSDNTIWNSSDEKWEPLVQAELLENKISRWLIDQYRWETVKDAKYVVTDDLQHEVWICTCGAINRQSETRCQTCHSEKEKLIASLNAEVLSQHEKLRKQGQAEIKEAEEKSKRKRFAIIGTIATVCVALIITLIVAVTNANSPNGIWIPLMVDNSGETVVFALNDDEAGISLIYPSSLYRIIRDNNTDSLYVGMDVRLSGYERENDGDLIRFSNHDLYMDIHDVYEFEKKRYEDGSMSLVLKVGYDDEISFIRLSDDTINKIRSGEISMEDFENTFFNF